MNGPRACPPALNCHSSPIPKCPRIWHPKFSRCKQTPSSAVSHLQPAPASDLIHHHLSPITSCPVPCHSEHLGTDCLRTRSPYIRLRENLRPSRPIPPTRILCITSPDPGLRRLASLHCTARHARTHALHPFVRPAQPAHLVPETDVEPRPPHFNPALPVPPILPEDFFFFFFFLHLNLLFSTCRPSRPYLGSLSAAISPDPASCRPQEVHPVTIAT